MCFGKLLTDSQRKGMSPSDGHADAEKISSQDFKRKSSLCLEALFTALNKIELLCGIKH